MFNDWDFAKVFLAISLIGMVTGFALFFFFKWLWDHVTIGWM